MIFAQIIIKNLYSFDDFTLNFTYDRKIKYNTVGEEHLKDFSEFKYRKVNILMGSNSSGKTSVGKVMMSIQNLLSQKTFSYLPIEKINKKNENASINVDFVENGNLYNYVVEFNLTGYIKEELRSYKLKKKDSYKVAKIGVSKQEVKAMEYDRKNKNEISEILIDEKLSFGWLYSFALISEKDNNHVAEYDLKIMEKILKGFDCTIDKIEKITGKKSFNIIFKNGDNLAVQDNKAVNDERISSGTLESIRIASILSQMKENERNYFIDENIVHSHTEMEKGILNAMINLLYSDSQLFFTTHNMDILEMNLPIHAYQILGNKFAKSYVVDVKNKYKKNDRNLRNYIENDEFKTLPDGDFLLEIE